MGKKTLPVMLITVLVLLLWGCAGEAAETTAVPTAAVDTGTVEATVAQTAPPVPETQPIPDTQAPTEPSAEIITQGVSVLVDGGDYTVALSDGDLETIKYLYTYHTLEVVSETPFSSLYIQWDTIPGSYEILWEGGSVTGGVYGFLHEYIRLPEETNHVTFRFSWEKAYATLCDVVALTAGSPPEGVQDWLPPCEEADILVFPTHSDDDVLFFGPLISYYAIDTDFTVQTAFMVNHAGYPQRAHERLNGLWAMGVRRYPVLGNAPDTESRNFYEAKTFYGPSNIERWQVEQIRRFRPLVVVGHDLKGEYGNGGHQVNAYYLVSAIAAAEDPEIYPELAEQYGVWRTPKLYLHLYEENEIVLDVEVVLQRDPLGRTPFAVAEDAYQAHVSQHGWLYRVQYGGERMFDCRPFGLYRTLVGPDTKADIMDNIDPARWRGNP